MTANRVLMTRLVMIWVGLFVLVSSEATAQNRGWDGTGLNMTREELQQVLARFDAAAASPSYSGALREQAREEAALIRERLQEGDIRVGDRVLLIVETRTELTDSFTVVAGRKLVLPDIGEVALQGVLRSELQNYLTTHIAKFIRNPVVHARSLIRLEIMGAVGRPGFYTIPSDVLVSDALMLAGGPTSTARLDHIRVERGERVIWDGERMTEARLEGRTLDQLSVRAGDRIEVPGQSGSRFARIQSVVMMVGAVASLLLVGQRIGLY